MNTFYTNTCDCVFNCRFNQCFGVIGVLDYLHGTNNQFRNSKAYDRHTLLIGSTPAYVLYPDSPKEKKQRKIE